MELFEMIHQPDLACAGHGGYGRDCYRITTGGTAGSTLVAAADNLAASGMYDVVMAIGFEKLQEGHTTGITNMADALWARTCRPRADRPFGREDDEGVRGGPGQAAAMTLRIIMDKHACLN
jgi:acetyl-CoA C-acetyltransferase